MATRRALLAPAMGLALALILAPVAATAAPDRQVFLVVVPALAFQDALDDPLLAELAGAGGVGLMTTSGRAAEPSRTAVNLGAGRSATDAPAGAVPVEEGAGAATVDIEPYREAAGEADPGLLGSTLSEAGLAVGYVDATPGEVAMLAAMDRDGRIPAASFDASTGGDLSDEAVAIVRDSDVVVLPTSDLLGSALEASGAGEVLVIVAGAGASDAMLREGDTVGPILVARGSPAELLAGAADPGGLTSDTTRLDGVVSDVDVAPTILDFLGVPVPDEMVGAQIRPSDGSATDLHERYLEYRSLVGPIGAAILGLALAALFSGLAVVFLLSRPVPRLAGAIAFAMLVSLALFVATTPASVLARVSTAAVIACLVVVGGVVFGAARRAGRADPRAAVAAIAVVGLALVVVDGVLGWPSRVTPLLGGGALDGERFFGLGNAHAGIVLAGAVLGAARLPTRAGVGLIAAAAAFAGLPFLGADLGGCLTLAIAAALWFGLRTWRSLGWRTWALVLMVSLGAAILVTVADRVLPGGGTHLSQAAGDGGLGGTLDAAIDRLGSNVRATTANASAWLAVLGLPFWLVIALRRPKRVTPALEPDERWRDAVVVLTLAGIAGYLLNDTYGLAGSVFAFASAAVLYPTLVAPRAAPTEPVPR